MSEDANDWSNLDSVYVATLPESWGRVVKLESRNGKVIATSETGDTMILPVSGQKDSPATS